MDAVSANLNNTEKFCSMQNFTAPEGELWCNWAWDLYLCWPPTKASSPTRQRCPLVRGVDTNKFVERRCAEDGQWEGSHEKNMTSGWTNFTHCFPSETLVIIRKFYSGSEAMIKMKTDIINRTRTLEFVGLSISLAAILASLLIFFHFRSLRNIRTRIHKNLFIAMMVQIIIRLTLYIDQEISRKSNNTEGAIEQIPILCETGYILLEYAKTAMFMWMFIEGLFLNNVLSVRAFKENSCYPIYRLVGWGCPIIMTMAWAIVTAFYNPLKCWWNYNLKWYFWILEGPRMAVILFNFLFLLNIIRTLVGKLRRNHISEIQQARKAARAALVLLPLLGITNVVHLIEAPLDKTFWEFAIWSYATHFLSSFQGLFIATLYCFLNGEVKLALDKMITTYMSVRDTDLQIRRQSATNP